MSWIDEHEYNLRLILIFCVEYFPTSWEDPKNSVDNC